MPHAKPSFYFRICAKDSWNVNCDYTEKCRKQGLQLWGSCGGGWPVHAITPWYAMTWKNAPYHLPFVWAVYWSPVCSHQKGQVMLSFDVLFVVSLNKLLNKGSSISVSVIADAMTLMRLHYNTGARIPGVLWSLGWVAVPLIGATGATCALHMERNIWFCSN